MGRLFFILLMFSVSLSMRSTRLVATYYEPDQNTRNVTFASVVKKYGKRLVLDFGRVVDLEQDENLTREHLGDLQSVELDHLVHLSSDVGPELVFSDMDAMLNSTPSRFWNLMDAEPYSIHAQSAWSLTNSTPEISVAVLDSGLAVFSSVFDHIGNGFDFITDPILAMDNNGRDSNFTDPGDEGRNCSVSSWHGTMVSSVLAARHDSGLLGVASNCTVLPIRVLGMCSTGYASDVADAIVWASGGIIHGMDSNHHPARIISMSFAGKGACPSYLQSAVSTALAMGALLVASSGNNGLNTSDYFPANCIGVMSVSASTRDGHLAPYSNYGLGTDLAAPGGDNANPIAVLSKDGLVHFVTGTSFAVPQVAGVAALIWSLYPNASVSGVWDYLMDNNTEGYDVDILSAYKVGRLPYHESIKIFVEPIPVTGNLTNQTVYATGSCGTWADSSWTTYKNQNAAGYGPTTWSCTSGCIVTNIDVMYGGTIDRIGYQSHAAMQIKTVLLDALIPAVQIRLVLSVTREGFQN